MNRQQRRKGARATVVDPAHGMAVTGLGTTHHLRTAAELPPKVPGVHRWVATVAYVLTDDQARAALPDQPEVTLAPSMVMACVVGCWDCELEYEAAAGYPCPPVVT